MPDVHETEDAQEDIGVAGAGVIEGDSDVDGVIDEVRDIDGVFDGVTDWVGEFDAVIDCVGEFDAVDDGVKVPDRVDVSVAEVVGVAEAEPPAVIDEVGVTEGEQDINTERPAVSQQVHGSGAVDASGQKLPTGHIVGIVTPLAQKLPAGQGSVATVHRMPASGADSSV